MRWTIMALGIVTVLVVWLVPPAAAQPAGQSQAVVALHTFSGGDFGHWCKYWNYDEPCSEFTTTWPLEAGTRIYVIVARADSALGVSGISLGVTYQTPGGSTDGVGVDVFGYVTCADYEFREGGDGSPDQIFPASGGGNRLFWEPTTNCQRHVVSPYGVETLACVIYVYAYGPDQFAVIPNPAGANGPEFQVVDCVGPTAWDLEWPSHAGVVGFGMDGYNPCIALGVPVEATTWGRLKSQYH